MKKIFNLLSISICLLLLGTFVISCSKEEQKNPPAPTPTPTPTPDDPSKKTTFEWTKLEVRFTKGHSHGYFHGNPDYPVKYLKTVQRFYFENKNGVVTPAAENPTAIRWEGTNVQEEDHHDDDDADHDQHNAGVSLYGIELIFYNKEGKRVNSQFSTGEAPNHYQFFFKADNFVGVAGNTTIPTQVEALDYKYRDTNPEDLYIRGGKKIDKNQNAPKGVLRKEQIGLKGFFEVKRTYINFDLHIILGKFDSKPDNLTYSTLPTNKIIEMKIPIHIYTDILQEDKQIEDAIREFGATKEEIEKDQSDIIASDLSPESSGTFL